MGDLFEPANGCISHCSFVCCSKFPPWSLRCVVWCADREGIFMRANKTMNYIRLRDQYQPDTAKWGVLGHAAEFLVSKRGFHAKRGREYVGKDCRSRWSPYH